MIKAIIRLSLILFIVVLSTYRIASAAVIKQVGDVPPMLLIEDHYLPIVAIELSFENAGYAYQDESLEGVAHFTSEILSEGTKSLPQFAYKQQLIDLASSITFSADHDVFTVKIKSLTENLQPTLELVRLALTEPELSADAIERIKQQLQVQYHKNMENPSFVGAKALRQAIFDGHEYSKQRYSLESLNAMSATLVTDYINRFLTQENITISVAGDLNSESIKGYLTPLLTSLAKGSTIPTIASFEPTTKPQEHVHYIYHDVPQSTIAFGSLAPSRAKDEFYAYYMANHIIGGGGFESRLMDTLRTKNGLVYSVSSFVNMHQHNAALIGFAATQTDNVDNAISLIRNEFMKFHKHGTTSAELADAKNYIIHSFPLRLTRNQLLASFIATSHLHRLPLNYIETRKEHFGELMIDEIDRSAYEWFHPNQLHMIVVGRHQQQTKGQTNDLSDAVPTNH